MNKILFCQFSTIFLNKDIKKDIAGLYYESIYIQKHKEGYYKGVDFWEIPLWICEISGLLKDDLKELYIIKNLENALCDITKKEINYILFSVLDINKNHVLEFIKKYTGTAKFLLGGYVDFKEFLLFDNVIILKDIKELARYLKIEYNYNVDFSLFKGIKTIPRLTLSTGCFNRCKFCTIEKIVIEKSKRDILKQIKSFKELNFKLIYLNDKTLGQAFNYKFLPCIYKRIKKYNKDFKGFIIQTTTGQLLKKDFINTLKKSFIFAVEIGIESYNNNILKELKKPQTIKTINKAIKILKALKIKIIPNLVIGFLLENKKSYNNTFNFINKNKNNFYILNIYNLTVYDKTELSKEIKTTSKDNNELEIKKSFYNNNQNKNNQDFYNSIFSLGLKIISKK